MAYIKKSCERPWIKKREIQGGRTNPNKKFYQSMPWRNVRAIKIKEQPLCEECLSKDIIIPANVVDHIIPINKGGEPLDIHNLQSLCHTCHNRKSGKERYQ